MNKTILSISCVFAAAILCLHSLALAQPVAVQATPVPAAGGADYAAAALPNIPGSFGLGLSVGNMVTGVTAKLWAASTVA